VITWKLGNTGWLQGQQGYKGYPGIRNKQHSPVFGNYNKEESHQMGRLLLSFGMNASPPQQIFPIV